MNRRLDQHRLDLLNNLLIAPRVNHRVGLATEGHDPPFSALLLPTQSVC